MEAEQDNAHRRWLGHRLDPRHSRRIRALAPLAAVASALVVTSCAAGQQAQTADEKPTLDTAYSQVGNLDLRGVVIAAPSATPSYKAGDSAQLQLVVVNHGKRPDKLVGVSGKAIGGWSSGGAQSVAIPPGARVSFGTPDATKSLQLSGFTKQLFPGQSVKLTFTFSRAGSVSMAVPVALTRTANQSVVPGPSATGQVG